MDFVKSINEIKKNMQTLDKYIERKCDPEYSFALERIKLGTCFIAVESEEGYRFYPSRFIGYAENTMDKHDNNTEKDGTKTNPAISSILKEKPLIQIELESEYIKYCRKLGFVAHEKGAFGVKRKYWKII